MAISECGKCAWSLSVSWKKRPKFINIRSIFDRAFEGKMRAYTDFLQINARQGK